MRRRRPVVLPFDDGDSDAVVRVPRPRTRRLCQKVFVVALPRLGVLGRTPIGNRDAKATGRPRGFVTQVARLVDDQHFHPSGHLLIPRRVPGQGAREDDRRVGRAKVRQAHGLYSGYWCRGVDLTAGFTDVGKTGSTSDAFLRAACSPRARHRRSPTYRRRRTGSAAGRTGPEAPSHPKIQSSLHPPRRSSIYKLNEVSPSTSLRRVRGCSAYWGE